MAVVAALLLGALGASPRAALAASEPTVCTVGTVLPLEPGLPPSSKKGSFPPVARDIPRDPISVSVPLYLGAQPLDNLVGSPLHTYPRNPYLQTGVAEYQSPEQMSVLQSWYLAAFGNCEWRQNGSMRKNTGVLSSGIRFVSKVNGHLDVWLSFGTAPGGGTYVGYVLEEVTLPPRPAGSYLHGPFSEIRIAERINTQAAHRTVHATVRDRGTIQRLVRAVNSIKDIYVPGASTRRSGLGPAWLTFVRSNGQSVHVWDSGTSLHVGSSRALADDGRVWNLISRMVK